MRPLFRLIYFPPWESIVSRNGNRCASCPDLFLNVDCCPVTHGPRDTSRLPRLATSLSERELTRQDALVVGRGTPSGPFPRTLPTLACLRVDPLGRGILGEGQA